MMSTTAHADRPELEPVHRPTAAEWQAATQRALDEVGITYEELERQAEDRNFQSAEALNLWVIIGDSRI
jgi:hypothetical protein